MNLKTLALTVSLGLLAMPALAERSWTWTGPKGGKAAGTADCASTDGGATCNRSGTYTSPEGKEFKRESTATGDRFGGQRVITTTGPDGKTVTATRTWKRD